LAVASVRARTEEIEQPADVLAELGDMAHRLLAVDRVFVAPPDAFPLNVPRVDELGKDPLRRPFGDPDGLGDVAKTYVRILADA
jgi:hypothetical protein